MAIWDSRRHHAPYAIAVATGPAYCPNQPAGSPVQSKPASAVSLALYYTTKFVDVPSCIIVAKNVLQPAAALSVRLRARARAGLGLEEELLGVEDDFAVVRRGRVRDRMVEYVRC